MAVHVLDGELVGRVVPAAEGLDVDELARRDLVVDVAQVEVVVALDVLGLEFDARGVGMRDHVEVEPQREQRDQRRRRDVGHHHPVVADAAGQDGDDLGVRRHPGGEEDHRDEDEQRGEHVDQVRDVVAVVVEDDRLERRLVLDEVVYLLREVEDDDHDDDEQHRQEEGRDELLRDVPVYFRDLLEHVRSFL